eukprot:jgi/Hompol1/4443/HPOL_000205-RA
MTNRIYYFNPETKESHWEKPVGNDVSIKPLDKSSSSAESNNGSVRASHLLVKHNQSRRPSSWKEQNITRSKEEAYAMIAEFRRLIVSGETDLATLAQTESDCSSAAKGGDLGVFSRGQMQLESDSGIHLILRTE